MICVMLGELTTSDALHEELRKRNEELSEEDARLYAKFRNGVIVTSVRMAKGLEFDEVIVPKADSYDLSGFDGELYLNVSYVMKDAEPLLEAGTEVAYQQILLREKPF